MSAQAADPRSMMYPKPSWSERGPGTRFRLCYSHEEALLLRYHADRARSPSRCSAYVDFVERELGRDR